MDGGGVSVVCVGGISGVFGGGASVVCVGGVSDVFGGVSVGRVVGGVSGGVSAVCVGGVSDVFGGRSAVGVGGVSGVFGRMMSVFGGSLSGSSGFPASSANAIGAGTLVPSSKYKRRCCLPRTSPHTFDWSAEEESPGKSCWTFLADHIFPCSLSTFFRPQLCAPRLPHAPL